MCDLGTHMAALKDRKKKNLWNSHPCIRSINIARRGIYVDVGLTRHLSAHNSFPKYLFFFNLHSGVEMGPLDTSATEWPIVPAPGDYDDGEFGGMKISRGNRSTRRKPAPAPLCPPQIQLDQTWV
jgi:hypothetical protein